MNVVMIGTGDIAYSHGRAVVKLGGKVIAAYDVNQAGLAKYCAEFGSEALSYEQLDEWIPKADYVVLCTPPTKRLDYVEKVLSAMPGAEGAPKSQKVLEINADHPIFATLQSLQEKGETEKLGKYARILYDQALLIEGLPIEDPVAYAQAVCELMQ